MSSFLELTLNIILHILILFTILSALFWYFIADISSTALSTEIEHAVEDSFGAIKRNMPQEQVLLIRSYIANFKQPLNVMHATYSKPDKVMLENNKWLSTTNKLMIFMLLLIVLAILITLKLNCGIYPPFLSILKENIAVFLFIGIVEAIFFFKIAMKFIPVLPSALSKDFLQAVKNGL